MTSNSGIDRRRRAIVAGSVLAGASACFPSAVPDAVAQGAPAPSRLPGFYRFSLGEAEITVVSDGPIFSGDPRRTFRGAPPQEISELLTGSFLENDRVRFAQNGVVLNSGGRLTLFDTGMGGLKSFGPDAGQLLGNLRAAGIDPARIDAVVLSHGHIDHINGVIDSAGHHNFPNARFYMNQVDHDFWLDPANTGTAMKLFHERAVANLVPIRDRLRFIADGEEFLPGVQAVAAPGHTVGHMIFMISSAGQTLAHITDLARHHILNLETPRWEFVGDTDPARCVTTRIRLLDMVAANKTRIISYHYPWPGVGHIAAWGDRYRYYPDALAV